MIKAQRNMYLVLNLLFRSRVSFMRLILCFFLFSTPLFSANLVKKSAFLNQCLSSREYITTVGFLRDKKFFKLDQKQILSVAGQVSQGCTGASKRFIIVTNLLVKTGLNSKDAIRLGIKFSAKTDKEVKTFTYIYKRAFLKKFLDLDIKSSIEVATMLSDKFDGNHSNSQRTFNQVLGLCNRQDGLDLPNKKCAILAARVAKSGEGFKRPIGDGFRSLFHYLIKKSGPNLPAFKALELAEEVMKNGPLSSKNFILAFKFATSKKGLNIPNTKAIEFAKLMAKRTLQKELATEL